MTIRYWGGCAVVGAAFTTKPFMAVLRVAASTATAKVPWPEFFCAIHSRHVLL